MSDLQFFRAPHVVPLARTGDRQPYFIVRTLYANNGRGLLTQALTVDGDWVDRPEGFLADAEVTFYGKRGEWFARGPALTPSQHLVKALVGFYTALKNKVCG